MLRERARRRGEVGGRNSEFSRAGGGDGMELVVSALRRFQGRRGGLWPPFFNRMEPTWLGMPFFYWYQLLWVMIGAVLTAIVYFATEPRSVGSGRLIDQAENSGGPPCRT